ncbi:MAG: hypothetical protein JWM37_106 [Candidatus Saccharibacteria bacterium]|nr:hypothetical protein [Candidatus Saccharibacteria bacterium]
MTTPDRLNLYVGCGLTAAPEAFVDEVDALKDTLRERFNVFDFVGLTAGTSGDVYNWDIGHCVADCDMFVAVCDYPAIGLGWELAEATRLGKPTLGVAHVDSRVTRLVLGAAEVLPTFTFERYEGMVADVPELVVARFGIEAARAVAGIAGQSLS